MKGSSSTMVNQMGRVTSAVPSMVDRPFGCPPDKPQSRRVDTKAKAGNLVCSGAGDPCADVGPASSDKPRCACGSKLKTVGTVNNQPKCGRCFREIMRQAKSGTKRSKYGVDMSPAGKLRRTVDGHVFDSEGEARRYGQLKLLQKQGYIRSLEPNYELNPKDQQPVYQININGKLVCNVKLDFRYFEGQTRQLEDFKGKDNPLSRLKRKLVEAAYPGTKVKVVR